MKILSHSDTAVDKDVIVVQSPVNVCMHVREVARVDVRVLREARALVEEGYAVTIVDVERDRTVPLEEDFDGIHVKHIMKPHWHTPVRMPWRLLRSAEKFIYSTLTMIRISADIYHAHDVKALPACYITAMVHRKPLIFDAHELPLNELDRSGWHRLRTLLTRLLTRIIARCSGVITVSPPIAQEICKRYQTSNVTLVRNILAYQAVPKSDRLRQHLGLGSEVRIALYQGNIQADRRLDRLVHAAAFLERDIVIVLMGKKYGETASELEALAAREGVADRIKILPPVPYAELLEWTASADAGLIIYSPDHSLNVQMCLPNKLFEYLMAGLPVLATPLDAVAEILANYDVGRIVPSLVPADVAAAINAMLEDRVALERMHHNALHAVQQDLCWEQERQQLIHLYTEISNN